MKRYWIALVALLLFAAATSLLRVRLPYVYRLPDIGFAIGYAAAISLLLPAIALTVGRLLKAAARTQVSILLFLAIILFLDPYSQGYTGGHFPVRANITWQVIVAVFFALVLLSGSVMIHALRYRAAASLLLFEFFSFIALNGYFVIRDGAERWYVGYEAAPLPLAVVGLGLVGRLYLLIWLYKKGV